nr:coiled-coil domain-containing protein 186-like [Tanacetum cinerariifolium]
PFHNLEICDSNDPPLGVYIESRFLVNSETVELLTFTPSVRDSPKGMLVIVYWLLIFAAKGTSPKILEVIVDEVCKWNDTTTSVIRPPLFESDGFVYWKNRFETYVKSKDLDLWHVIIYGDFPPTQNNPKTKKGKIVPFDRQSNDLKKRLAKNNEAKMGLPPDVYAIVNHHKVSKEIWEKFKLLMQGMKLSLQEREYLGLVVLVFTQGDDPIAYLNKEMAFMLAVAASRFPSTNNQLRTSFNSKNQATIQDDEEQLAFRADLGIPDGQATQTTIPNNANFQTKYLDTYDSDCDDVSNAKAILMSNLFNYGLDVISEAKANQEKNNESSTVELERIEAPSELPKEKIFFITALKNDLRKFKGKDIVDNVVQVSNATTITPGVYKLDPVTLTPTYKNNRETHIYYLKHTMKQAAILREIVKQAKSLNLLDSASYSACKYVKLIQDLLGYVRDTCTDIHKLSKKLVVVTPINKKKMDRFAEPVISSSTS